MTPDKQMSIPLTHFEDVIRNLVQLNKATWELLQMIIFCNHYGESYP